MSFLFRRLWTARRSRFVVTFFLYEKCNVHDNETTILTRRQCRAAEYTNDTAAILARRNVFDTYIGVISHDICLVISKSY